MSLDTSTLFLQHQILDLAVSGGTTLSGVDAREIIEDYLADALTEGDNISITYTDVPTPGIVEIATTQDMTISGSLTFGTVISGTGDIYCNDLHAAASSIYLGGLKLTYNGTHLVIPAEVQSDGDMGTDGDLYVGNSLFVRQQDNYNITFGYDDAGAGLTTGATDNIFIGRDAGKETTASDHSVYIGYRAGYETGISYTGTHENVFIGREAGRDAQWQRRSVFIGPYAGAEATDNNSYYNIAIGYMAGHQLRNSYNVVIGYDAMIAEASTDSYQYRNVILGYQAGRVLSGNDNVCLGYRAGGMMYAHLNDNVAIGAHAMTTDHGVGTSNEQRGSVAIGRRALYIQESAPGALGYYNVAIGQDAGYCNNQQLMGKDYNVFLGSSAGTGSSGSSNVFIGYQAGTNVSDSNRLYIANTSTTTPLIYGEFDTPFLSLNSEIYVAGDATISGGLFADGDIEFGGTISGTGDIYCSDLYTAGSSVHIGDYIELTDTGSALAVNAPVEVGGSNASLEFSSTSGTIGVTGMGDLLVLDADKLTINGDFVFDQNTISGTGDVHCGDLIVSGDVWYEDTFWDDLRVPSLQTRDIGTRVPDIEMFQDSPGYFGVYCYYFDPDALEEVHFSIQLPHSYKEGTDIHPHVHWSPTTASGGDVRWLLEYTWANVGDVFQETSVLFDDFAADGVEKKQQIASLGTISGTGMKISSMIMCRLVRAATNLPDTYPHDAAFLEFDIHFEINSPGSRQEYIK